MPRQAQANLAAVIESTEDLIWSVDLDFRLTSFNTSLQRHINAAFGRRLEAGMVLEDWLPPEQAALWPPLFERALKDGLFRIEHCITLGRVLDLALNRIVVNGKATGLTVLAKDITEQQCTTMQLRDSEERYRTSFEQAAIGIAHASFTGQFLRCNARFAEMIGYTIEEVPGLTFQQIAVPGDRPQNDATHQQMMAGLIVSTTWEKRHIRKDGSLNWVKLTVSTQRNAEGRALHFIAFVEDIHARKVAEEGLAAAQEALRLNEQRYRTVFLTSPDVIAIVNLNEGTFIDANKAFFETTGFQASEVIGRTTLEINLWANPLERHDFVQMLRENSNCRNLEVRFRRRNGEIFSALLSATVIEIEGNSCIVEVIRDISGVKEAAEQIRNLALYDPLTQLPNRRLLFERMEQTPPAPRLRKRALLFIDLDDFRTLNDTLGHMAGDLLLQEVAARLTNCLREGDIVARLGGDEFVLILEYPSHTAEEAATQAEMTGEKILAAIGQPFLLAGHALHKTASIGIAVFEANPESTMEVLQQAEIAMYQAKAAGPNSMRFFSPALQAAVHARAALEEDLRQAIKSQQFALYYQPQVDRDHLIGAEALIRWNHPTRGLLLPAEFIPLAEETGLILPLGDWVLETACQQIAAWARSEETAHLSIAVNISVVQFRQPGFVENVLAALKRTGANPKNLDLELTESILADNIEEVIERMSELKYKGLRFSLDDFGTGYSSLAYLKRLPLDQLKIDRSFVRDILVDGSSGAIAQTIISLSRAMGLTVIAEGIETKQQLDFLSHLGCHAFQGFLFGRALPLEGFQRLWLDAPDCLAPVLD